MKTNKESIKKSALINAPKEKVWDVLFTDSYTRIWYAAFSPGSHAETDWRPGSKAVFTDDSQSGLIGEVIENEPHEKLSVEYTGMITDSGSEDYDSDLAQQVKGDRETYHISEGDGVTYLQIECDILPEQYEVMSAAWDQALQKIKALSEA